MKFKILQLFRPKFIQLPIALEVDRRKAEAVLIYLGFDCPIKKSTKALC
jgi:hypothetical protein